MSHITICDICGKKLEGFDHVDLRIGLKSTDYCNDCWKNKKNWSKIHKIEKDAKK